MAGSRAQTLLRPSRDWSPLTLTGALTVANLITDDTRLAGVQGDGATYPASMAGVWPAATNLVTNGGFETNTTGWARGSNKYFSLTASSAAAKFGSKSMLATGVGASSTTFQNAYFTLASAPIGTYTVSAWFLAKNQTCPSCLMRVENTTDGATLSSVTSVGTSTWVKITVTKTTTAVENLVISLYSNYSAVSTGSGGEIDMYFDGVQIETGSIATPYIETNGGTASRSAGRIQMPASVLDETQGWVVFRVLLGVQGLVATGYFDWNSGTTNMLDLRIQVDGTITARSRVGTTNNQATQSSAQIIGATETIIMAWDAVNVHVSANGAARTSTARSAGIPVIGATTFDIGSIQAFGATLQTGSTFWFAAGKGTLTDADAALFHAWGNNDPLPHMFPRSAQLTFLARFNGDGTAYRYKA